MDEFLSYVFQSPWVVFALPGLLLIGFAEVGFRLGLHLYLAKDAARKGQIGGIQGARRGPAPPLRRGAAHMAATGR